MPVAPSHYDRLIESLILRLKLALPYRNTKPARGDSVTRTITALRELCRYRLLYVLQLLQQELEVVIKLPKSPDVKEASTEPSDQANLGNLTSQMILAQAISQCLSWHWDACQASPANRSDTLARKDPPPLDDRTAKQLLGTISFFLKQDSLLHKSTPSTKGSFSPLVALSTPSIASLRNFPDPALLASPASSKRSRQFSAGSPDPRGYPFPKPPTALIQPTPGQTHDQILGSIGHSVGIMTAYVSASRWDVMQAKLSNRITYYSTSPDEIIDLSEARLIEECEWTTQRLSGLLGDLANFGQIKKAAQLIISGALQKSITKMYTKDPYALIRLYSTERNPVLETHAGNLFQLASDIADNSKRRPLAWPLMATLLPLCVGSLTKMVNGEDSRPPSLNRKAQFLADLRKASRNITKSDEANLAFECYAIMCHAASYSEGPASILRSLVKDKSGELLNRLCDPGRPFVLPDGALNTALTSDALLVNLKLDPQNVIRDVLPRLIDRPATDQTVISALGACSAILEEKEGLPLHPSGIDIGLSIIGPIRRLIHHAVTSTFGVDETGLPSLAPRQQAKSYMGDITSSRNVLLLAILRLLAAEPNILHLNTALRTSLPRPHKPVPEISASELLGLDYQNALQSFQLLSCLMDEHNHPSVRQAVIDFFLQLQTCTLEEIQLDHPQYYSPASILAQTISPIGLAFVRDCLQAFQSGTTDIPAFERLASWLALTVKALAQTGNRQIVGADGVIEGCELIALLSLVYSEEEDRTLLGSIFEQVGALAGLAKVHQGNSANLARMIKSGRTPVVGGRLAQTKRLMKLFSGICVSSAGLAKAWDEVWRRWLDYTNALEADATIMSSRNVDASSPPMLKDLATEEEYIEWTQSFGFLAASLKLATSAEASALASAIPHEVLPASFDLVVDRTEAGSSFLRMCTRFLFAQQPRVRDTARDLLSNHLDPIFLPSFISLVHPLTAALFTANEVSSLGHNGAGLHFDQILSVMLGMLQRQQETLDWNKTTISNLEDVALAAFYWASILQTDTSSTRLKSKSSRLAELLLQEGRAQTFSIIFRNCAIGYLLDFAAEGVEHRSEKSSIELQTSFIQALAYAVDSLPITRAEPSYGGSLVRDTGLATSYVTRLLLIAEAAAAGESPHVASHQRQASMGAPSSTKSSQSQIALFLAALTQSIRHIIVANPAIDLACLHPSEHDCQALQTVKLRAILSCLQARSSNSSAARDGEYLDDALEAFCQILCQPEMTVPLAIMELATSPNQDGLMEVLFELLESNGLTSRLLEAVISKEVRETNHESTLFRGNSSASRLLTVFARRAGYLYLRSVARHLLDMLDRENLGSLDLDGRIESLDDDNGSTKIEAIVTEFLAYLCKTWEDMPASMRAVCHHIKTSVEARFPDSTYAAIGGWVFLRFINPAIISPELADLELPGDSRGVRRALVFISKLLQSLSNNIRLEKNGTKAQSSFSSSNILGMTAYLSHISSEARNTLNTSGDGEKSLTRLDLLVIYHFVWNNTEQIGSILLARASSSPVPDATAVMPLQNEWSRLNEVLWRIKQELNPIALPLSHQPIESIFDLKHPDIKPVILNTPWEGILRSGFQSRKGHPAFCLNLRRIDSARTDIAGLVQYLLRTLAISQEPIEVLLDCTGFSQSNEIPHEWINAIMSLANKANVERLHALYFFSPSTCFLRYFRKLASLLSFESMERKMFVFSDLQELEDAFPSPLAALETTSIDLATEEAIFDTAAVVVMPLKEPALAGISIGQNHVTLRPVRKRTLIADLKPILTDRFAREDIEAVMPGGNDKSIVILLRHGDRIVLLDVTDKEGLLGSFKLGSSGKNGPCFSLHNRESRESSSTKSEGQVEQLAALAFLGMSQPGHDHRLLFAQIFHESFYQHAMSTALDRARPSFQTLTSAETVTYLENAAESHPPSTGSFLLEILKSMPGWPAAKACHILLAVKPWLVGLVDYSTSYGSVVVPEIRLVLQHLIRCSITDEMLQMLLAQKIWPALIKAEHILPFLLDALLLEIKRLDLTEHQRKMMADIAGFGASAPVIRGRIASRLRKIVSLPHPQSIQAKSCSMPWPDVIALLRTNLAIAEYDASWGFDLAPELVHLYATRFTQAHSEHQAFLSIYITRLADAVVGDSDVAATVDEGRADYGVNFLSVDLSSILDKLVRPADPGASLSNDDIFAKVLVTLLDSTAKSRDHRNTWHAQLASLAIRDILYGPPAIRTRSLLLLSHLGAHDARCDELVLRLFHAALQEGREGPVHCFLLYLSRTCMSTQDPYHAGRLFWLALGISQAHPVLVSPAVDLLGQAVRCILESSLPHEETLQGFLLRLRNTEEGIDDAARDLDIALGVEFTQDTFSYAITTLLVKGMKEPHLASRITSLLKDMALSGFSEPHAKSNGAPIFEHVLLDNLGYIVAMLPLATKHVEGLTMVDLYRLVGLEDTDSFAQASYLPLLATVEISKNEPLVLGASLAMSLLQVAETEEEQFLLLSFLQEVAELSPAVVVLLQSRILPSLSAWVKTWANTALLDIAGSFLSIIMSTPADPRMPDVTAYVAALGFPNLLECSSFAAFVSHSQPEQTAYRLRCCADLLDAFRLY